MRAPRRFIDAKAIRRRLLAGWTGAALLFLYLPVALLLVGSFNASRLNITWGGFSAAGYAELWHDPVLLGVIGNSAKVAAATVLISVPLGTLGAWLVHRYPFFGRRAILAITYVPVVLPDVVIGVSLLATFAAVIRWGNARLAASGFDPTLGLGLTTVVLAHVTFCFPYVLVAVRARLVGLDPALEEAALDLGATPAVAFRRVVLPYLSPAIASGALMAFTLSLDELVVTFFTAGPGSQTLPLKIFGMARSGLSPALYAASVLFLLLTVASAAAAAVAFRPSAGSIAK